MEQLSLFFNNPLFLMNLELTSIEQDVLVMLIHKVDGGKDKQILKFDINEFKKLSGKTEKSIYSDVRKAVKGIWKKGSLSTLDGNLEMQVVSSIEKIKGKGIIEIEISKKIKPFLFEIKTKYFNSEESIRYFFSIKGIHSKKIYELCLMHYLTHNSNTLTIGVAKLREMLGIKESSYTSFKDFEKRVLKEAEIAINKVVDNQNNELLTFSYKKDNEDTKGKAINNITFCFDFSFISNPFNAQDYSLLKKMDVYINWGEFSFPNKERILIYKYMDEVFGEDNLSIILHINQALKHFSKINKSVNAETFILYLKTIILKE